MALSSNQGRETRPPLTGVREAPFALVRADESGQPNDGLTLDGYGAVFNRETIIDDWDGRYREKIANGSMRRSFREAPPKIQYDHGRHPLIGSIPIAELRSITEDSDPELAPDGGAHVIGRLFNNWLVEPLRDAIKAQAIKGMSFRFEVMRESWETPDGKPIRDEQQLIDELRRTDSPDTPDDELLLRTLKELRVSEIGPVAWPAYEATSVSVRSKIIDLGRLHEPGQRKLLAEAVFIADMASQQDEEAQRDTTAEQVVAVERPTESDTTQQGTAPAVAERLDEPEDAQQTTPQCVGERPSKSRQKYRRMVARQIYGVLLDIERNNPT